MERWLLRAAAARPARVATTVALAGAVVTLLLGRAAGSGQPERAQAAVVDSTEWFGGELGAAFAWASNDNSGIGAGILLRPLTLKWRQLYWTLLEGGGSFGRGPGFLYAGTEVGLKINVLSVHRGQIMLGLGTGFGYLPIHEERRSFEAYGLFCSPTARWSFPVRGPVLLGFGTRVLLPVAGKIPDSTYGLAVTSFVDAAFVSAPRPAVEDRDPKSTRRRSSSWYLGVGAGPAWGWVPRGWLPNNAPEGANEALLGPEVLLRVGWVAKPWLLLGFEGRYWYRAVDAQRFHTAHFDPTATFFPLPARGYYLKAGVGFGMTARTWGSSTVRGLDVGTGAGHEWVLSRWLHVGVEVDYVLTHYGGDYLGHDLGTAVTVIWY